MTKAETLAKQRADEDDFQKDLSINKYKLDEECLSHSSRYAYYAEAQAVAKTNISSAKDKLELVTAESYMKIREDFATNGQKVTEAVISSCLTMEESVINAKKELREAEEIYARLTVAVQAMETRRSELDNLVKLYCAGYFSTVNGANKKDINEQTSSDIRKNLNK